MKKNIKIIILFIVAVIALYFSKNKYENHGLSKSIMACTIAQKNKFPKMTSDEAKKYCEEEIKKKVN